MRRIMADDEPTIQKQIGARIDAAVRADPRHFDVIASLIGIKPPALNKMRAGESNKMYAKLALLAKTLNRSPNYLLGFEDTEREALIGALEGAFEGLGHPLEQAQALAAHVLRVVDTPEPGDRSQDPRARARSIAKFLILQAIVPQRK